MTNDEVHQKDTEKGIEKLLSVGIEVERFESVQVDYGKSKVVVKVKPIDRKEVEASEYPLSVIGWSIHCM